CITTITQPRCQVQLSLSIMGIVVVENLVKVLAMDFMLWRLDHDTIVTIGDAVQSFLQRADSTTTNCCLLSRSNLTTRWPKVESLAVQRWRQLNRKKRISDDWNSFGRVSIDHFLDPKIKFGKGSIIPFVLIVNSPQFIISILYLLYNGLFTGMLAGREWAQYAVKRAPLRVVTLPKPTQRSTHFLQLPYVWSIPLLIACALLHWLVSQSLFLAR
ncbi:hypothetical protein CC86DRAFT_264039, partial [Ophiobolus disseminans]